MTDTLKALLSELRQHPAFRELLKAVDKPRLPHYSRAKGMTAESFGADAIFASGELAQHERWIGLLTGGSSQTKE